MQQQPPGSPNEHELVKEKNYQLNQVRSKLGVYVELIHEIRNFPQKEVGNFKTENVPNHLYDWIKLTL